MLINDVTGHRPLRRLDAARLLRRRRRRPGGQPRPLQTQRLHPIPLHASPLAEDGRDGNFDGGVRNPKMEIKFASCLSVSEDEVDAAVAGDSGGSTLTSAKSPSTSSSKGSSSPLPLLLIVTLPLLHFPNVNFHQMHSLQQHCLVVCSAFLICRNLRKT